MSGIINGKFVKGIKPEGEQVSSQYRSYGHQMQRLDHRKDILQPRKDGKPNTEFIQAYPEEAKRYFNQEEIQRYGN